MLDLTYSYAIENLTAMPITCQTTYPQAKICQKQKAPSYFPWTEPLDNLFCVHFQAPPC